MRETFGALLAAARRKEGLSQRVLASRVKKENSDQSMTAQYLNDIEHDRRNPPSEFIIGQLADQLGLSKDRLCLIAGILPARDKETVSEAPAELVESAWRTFRKHIRHRAESGRH